MNNLNARIWIGPALILFLAPICLAQLSESKAKDLVRNSECNRTAGADVERTRITRREDLEDTLLDLEMAAAKKDYGQTFIFEVSETGNFRDSSGKIVSVSSTGIRSRLMAVSANSAKVFSLHGCSEAEEGFSALIRQSKISVGTKSQAETFVWFRYILIDDPSNQRAIVHSRQLRHVVEDFFFNKFPAEEAEKKFNVWSKTYKKIERKLVLGTSSNKTGNGFSASITYFVGSSDGIPRLFRTTLDISKIGEYSVRESRSILPNQ